MGPQPESREIDRAARLRAPPVAAPAQAPQARVRNFDEVFLPWTEDMVMAEAARCLHCPDHPCVEACPLGNDIPTALWMAEQGDFAGAVEAFQRTNNLAEICGRVCPQSEQCEGACPHNQAGVSPVAIGRIEAFLADRFWKERKWSLERPPCSGHRVAVVGAGPAGLTVAELLGKEGHCVTVFDQWPDGGGILRYGIPRFKLDHSLVRKRLICLRKLGVEFVFNTRIGDGRGIDALFAEGFEAVFLGTGSGLPATVEIPGSDLHRVYHSTPFLVRANVEQNSRPSELEDPPEIGPRVAVIGGGDTAMDCCRTAVRLGAEEVTCYYRRTEEEMPGNPRDRTLAREEGTRFVWLVAPRRILGDEHGRVRAIEFIRMTLGAPDGSGRRSPEPVPGSEFQTPADAVVLALGYQPDPSIPHETRGLATTRPGLLVADPATGRTARDRVWAGGDSVIGPSRVALAVAQARVAARDIHAFLGRRAH